mgnify:CR=1 FL=1
MPTYGWAGRILRVDLARGKIEEQSTSDYVPDYIGGRGIATRIAWDELKPGIGAFDPENLLMLFTGPLTGTTAVYSGRTEVLGLGPQGWPHEWFTRSGMGGRWGPELKYAGYDGIVVKGASDKPVYLWVSDGKAEIRDASHLWGKGSYETQQTLIAAHGRGTKVVTIGQAGENLSRIAVISTETESAAGQGGFGGVMGAKKLKAIAVRGTLPIRVAHPDEFYRKSVLIADECHQAFWRAKQARKKAGVVDPPSPYGQRSWACTQGCTEPCASYYTQVPGVLCQGQTHAGQLHCVAWLFQGMGKDHFYDWKTGFEAGFEASKFANDWGINHWELLLGIIPWLRDCREAGLLNDLDGMPIDLDEPRFWYELMRKIAFREGVGDILSEGGWRAHLKLGIGHEQARPLYAAWGYSGHWDGHGDHANYIVFPYWVVAGLQWAVDTRDPISSGHGYSEAIMWWNKFNQPEHGLVWEQMIPIGQRLFGAPKAIDPLGGYEDKTQPAHWHTLRSVLKDSVTVDDEMFPRIFSAKTEDGFARAGEMEGPSFEYHLFKEATGTDWPESELTRACERIINLDRGLQIRDFGRTRQDDECIIPYLETPENWPNPMIGEKQALDAEQFRQLMTQLYQLRGWDPETGRPTEAKLKELGLSEVAETLKASEAV